MKSNIFIPTKLNIGFQKRSDTYTGMLAYVIYYDEKGKLRKQSSWDNWRSHAIPTQAYDNRPTEGFVLNKKVGGENWGWNPRQTYCRVFDPRGFEFEITVPNLLYILEHTNSIKGKGLEGEFVYGWDGADLVLLPCDSPDYKSLQTFNAKVQERQTIKVKDLQEGGVYLGRNSTIYVYMGRYPVYDELWYHREEAFKTYEDMIAALNIDKTWTSYERHNFNNYERKIGPLGYTAFFFLDQGSNKIIYKKSLSGFLIDTIDVGVLVENFAANSEALQSCPNYSPPDFSKDWIRPYTLEEFEQVMDNHYGYIHSEDGEVYQCSRDWQYFKDEFGQRDKEREPEVMGFGVWNQKGSARDKKKFKTAAEIFELYKPLRCTQYLENGKIYKELY